MNTSGDGLLARAFEIAKSGKGETLVDVVKKLKAEGFGAGKIESHFDGPTIRAQIKNLCREAKARSVAAD